MKNKTLHRAVLAALISAIGVTPAWATTYQFRVAAPGVKASATPVTASTPLLGAWSFSPVIYGAAPFELSGPVSNSPGVFAYVSDNPAVATIAGGTISIVGAGSAGITATQDAAAGFTSTSAFTTLSVSPAAPVVGNFAPISKIYGDSAFNLTPPNTTGTFSYASSDPSIASISGNRVTVHTAGAVQITATQAAAGNYSSGSVTAQLNIAKVTPTFSAYTLPFKTMGAATYTITQPSSTPGTGTYSYTSSNTAVATISNDVVTLVGPGTSTITATRAASTNYNQASTTATLTVSPAPTPSDTAWNSLDKGADMSVSSSLVATGGGALSQWESVRANTGKSTGKYVFELKTSTNSGYISCGLEDGSAALVGQLGTTGTAIGVNGSGGYKTTMTPISGIGSIGSCQGTVMFAVDLDAGKVWIARGGVWLYGGAPSTGTNPTFTFPANTQLYPAASIVTGYSYTITANFGATAFVNPPPSGFTAGWY